MSDTGESTQTQPPPPAAEPLEFAGAAGTHPNLPSLPVLVAPALTDNERNTIRPTLIPIACWRVDDVRFEFDSSFVQPTMARELEALTNLIEEHTDSKAAPPVRPPASVFGHADPTGDVEYNKALSGRRAEAIYAMLIRDADRWEKLFSHPHGGDNWGLKSQQVMLKHLGHDPGIADSKPSPQTTSAFKSFQSANGLPPDGQSSAPTRRKLYRAYMDSLSGPRLLLDPSTDFLARNRDKDGKGDFQGCSEFNPALLFSQAEQAEFDAAKDKSGRNRENAPNRRVMIFLYRPGTRIDPAKWPCPRAKEGTAACRKRFWADATKRLTLGPERREFKKTQDTFACRFYHRMSDRSPCEGSTPPLIGLLHMQIFDGEGREVLAQRKYQIRLSNGERPRFTGVLNDKGILRHDFVPDGNYLLKVEGCAEETPMIVMDPSDTVPTVRYLETSSLAVFVRTEEGAPIDDATVSVTGLGDKKTDTDGIADFGLVKPGDFDFRVVKDDHVPLSLAFKFAPDRDIVKLGDSASGTVRVGERKAKPEARLNAKTGAVVVKEIKGTLAATKSTRTPPPKTLADNPLTPSTSNNSTPLDHVVLVRHRNEFVLEAVTEPAGQPVTWTVVANQSSAAPPAFTPEAGDTKVRIRTNVAGSFSAVATAKGGSTLRWNFVIVAVEVDVAKAVVNLRNDFGDAFQKIASSPTLSQFNIPGTMVGSICGEFAFGKHAWSSEVSVKLVGGGPKGDVGIDRVTPRFLQNLVFSNVVGEYPRGALGHAPQNSQKVRILDVGGTSGSGPGPVIGVVSQGGQFVPQWPVTTTPGMMELKQDSADKSKFTLRMGDSPSSGAFDAHIRHPDGATLDIQRISGFHKFAASVAAWSTDAPNTVAVHAGHEWLIDYVGNVAFPNGKNNRAVYAPAGAKLTNVTPWNALDPAQGGLEAGDSQMEIFGPFFTTVSNGPQTNTF